MAAANREQREETQAVWLGRDCSFVASAGFVSPLCLLSLSGLTGKMSPDLHCYLVEMDLVQLHDKLCLGSNIPFLCSFSLYTFDLLWLCTMLWHATRMEQKLFLPLEVRRESTRLKKVKCVVLTKFITNYGYNNHRFLYCFFLQVKLQYKRSFQWSDTCLSLVIYYSCLLLLLSKLAYHCAIYTLSWKVNRGTEKVRGVWMIQPVVCSVKVWLRWPGY